MQKNRGVHKKLNSRGFTLVEMAVTLTIVSLLLAVTFVGLRAWMRHAEFKKCNEYAHTIYTSASLELSALELAADLDRFTERVKASGTPLQTTAQLGNGAPEDVYEDGRMYAITADAGAYAQYQAGGSVSQQAMLVYELIDPYSYDKGVCNHTITIEYDSVSRAVYAVFISTQAGNFVYSDDHGGDYEAYDESGTVSLNAAADYARNRSTEVRKALMLGYYCIDDLGINAAFNEGQLRITECYLDNAETLDLVVASNSRHEEADVKYTATIYRTDGDKPLFDVTFSLMDLYAKGYKAAGTQIPHVIEVAVNRYNGTVRSSQTENMYFPLSVAENELRLTLDAAMSAQTGYVLDQGGSATGRLSTSFHRFLQSTADTPDIYASARVQQLAEDDLPFGYDQEKRGVRLWIEDEEYIIGSSVVSNTENAFFASVKDEKTGIGFVRHLANIRYCDPNRDMTFQLVNDLQFADAVIYDQNTARTGAENAMELMELHTTKAFPAIPEFGARWILTGEKALSTQDYAINQLVLTDESIVTSVAKADERYGMIGRNSGVVKHLAFNGSTATLGYTATVVSGVSDAAIKYELQPENGYLKVRAAGVLCGLNQGTVKNIAMDETTSAHLALNYTPAGSAAELTTAKMHGIGLVCGVHEGRTSLTDIRTAGELEGYIYQINTADAAAPAGEDAVQQRYRYAGIGGICGFTVGEPDGITAGQTATAIGAELTILDQVEDFLHLADRSSVKNTAEITGNTFVGGISGNIYLVDEIDSQLTDATNPIIDNCSNEGLIHLKGEKADLIACGTENAAVLEADGAHANADNCFAGGIVGYLQKGRIKDCTSAPGVNDRTFAEQVADAAPTGAVLEGDMQETKAHAYLTQYLTGNYVGGIAGCVVTGELRDCQTTEGGYVLGNDEVGGIVGYLASLAQTGSGASQNRLTMTDSKELQNSCYVIGHSDVGGIVGSNRAGNVLSDCVNEGIVVGAGRNIGGIAGINRGSGTGEKEQAVIRDCTSEVFDYDDSIFTRVSDVWQIYGDNVGGLVGLNEYGTVTRADQTKTNITSIVVGHNNVGGVFGMAGTETTFDFKHYTLDGGEVYASGDHVGGYIGVNLSAEALPSAADYLAKPYEVKPYSVRGRYAVGGAVGANVILQKQAENVQVLFSNANAFGTVYGANAVGGIIGYQRKVVLKGTSYDTVYPELTERLPSDGMDSVFASVRPADAADRTSIDGYETIWMTDVTAGAYAVSGRTTITGDNAATVIAGSYGGGILGYGCGYDNILVKDCTNSGDVSDWQASGVTGGELIGGSVAISDLYEKYVVSGQEHARPILDEAAYPYASMKQALGATAQTEPIGSFVGGIQGFVPEHTTISGCKQTGMIYAQNGFGGIAGVNLGTLKNCTVETNLGTQDSSLVGGIAALNGAVADVRSCMVGTTDSDYTIEGKNIVGGLFAVNGAQTVSAAGASRMYANISCALGGYGVGGLNGVLTGTCLLDEAPGVGQSELQISGGTAVGGIAGVMCGELQVQTEKVTNDTLAVNGVDAVGGVFGVLRSGNVVDQAAQAAGYQNAAAVTASNGCAGGIAGRLESGTIRQATNLEQAVVTAYGENGYAGGIVACVEKNGLVESCTNQADVVSMNSCAGGICAWNKGTLKGNDYICTEKTQSVSSDDDSMGVIAAYNDGTIESCSVDKADEVKQAAVTLQGNGSVIGGIVGTNTGTVLGCAMNVNYKLVTASEKDLTIGGAIGRNEWQDTAAEGQKQAGNSVKDVHVKNFNMALEGNCAYFGGLIGQSGGDGSITDCSVRSLTVRETDASLKGSCYGGLIGESASTVQNCTVKNITAAISGLYQANITLDASQQEKLASCVGGLVGKNETDGSIAACTLDTSGGYEKNQVVVENGLVGGITGINKGAVTTSGYQASGEDSAVAIADGVKNAISAYEKKYNKKSSTERAHVDLQTEKERVGYEYLIGTNETVKAMIKDRKTTGIPDLDRKLSAADFANQRAIQWMEENGDPKLLLQLTGNGSIGGITAYNTEHGTMQYCVTGQWLIDNRSSSQHSAQGGVIGTNESDQDTCFLINQAMVLRESASGVTERVNGGVIGYQHNTTDDQWKIYGCINTGMVINVNSHYSGGIIGRWSDQGGSIEYCRNYGVMQTSYQAEYKGAAGGIVAQLYHPLDEQSYTVLSCRNDGSILGVGSNCRSAGLSANDSGGIMGNIVTYEASNAAVAQAIQVNLIDCVNGPDVTIISKSMSSGILTFLTSDLAGNGDTALSHLELNIDRCRNYATDFVASSGGYVGIFSDRMSGHEKTRITNCFTVAVDAAIQRNRHKGYICYDGAAVDNVSYKYDGGKGAVCYNNHVLLVNTDNGEKTVDESVQMDLGSAVFDSYEAGRAEGMCYSVLHSTAQRADGLENLLKGTGAYTVSGTNEGAQLYIQLKQPMKLGNLKLRFGGSANDTHSYRVEYLTESADASGRLLGDHFTLAKEVIGKKGTEETVSFPSTVQIYALRIQYVQNGIDLSSNAGLFQQYGYYYSTGQKTFTLTGLSLTGLSGTRIPLEKKDAMVSPRLLDSQVTNNDRLRNGCVQYLYVADRGRQTYLVEPQFEQQRLSAGAAQRKAYSKNSYTVAGNELFVDDMRPYGTVYAVTDQKLRSSGANGTLDFEALDKVINDHYQSALAATMPYEDGSFLPETPIEADITLRGEDAAVDVSWANSIDGARNVVKYYLVTVQDQNGTEYLSEKKCIGNSVKLNITSDMIGKRLRASVRAVNENGTSGVCISGESAAISKPMLTPQIRLELVKSGSTYKYQISLENQKDYEKAYADNWEVKVYQQGKDQSRAVRGTITGAKPSFMIDGSGIRQIRGENYSPSRASWQLYAQAKSKDHTLPASEYYSTSVYTPKYQSGKNNYIVPGIRTLYAAFDENYQSELDAKVNVYVASDTSKTGIYPVYQVDLIRVDSEGEEHILAAKELAVSDQPSKVTFSELPEAFFDADKTQYFYVRAWVSQTGVGPVYTWHETDTLEQNGSLLVNTAEADQSYVTGALLADANAFGTRIMETRRQDGDTVSITQNDTNAVYAWTKDYAMTERPSMNVNRDVVAVYDSVRDQLSYTFGWRDTSEQTQSYELRIYGKGDDGTKVLLKKKYPIAKSGVRTFYQLVADDWTFDQLEVVVIQRDTGYAPGDAGSAAGKGKVVPRVLKKNVAVRTRLPKLSQPSVKLIQQNDLDYRISWQDISSRVDAWARGDLRYALYVESDGKRELLLTTAENETACGLEDYAGKTVRIYAVAYTDENDLEATETTDLSLTDTYFKSPVGLKKRLTIGQRLTQPVFADAPYSWSYRDYAIDLGNEKHVLTESQFTSNALKFNIRLTANGNYVMNAVLFDTREEAQQFIDGLPGTPYAQYVELERILGDQNYKRLSEGGKPIMLSLKNKKQSIYMVATSFKDISYAGGYLVPLVRATASTDISSYWSCGTPYQIPRVMLDTPNLEQVLTEKNYASFGESLRNSVSSSGTPFTNVTVHYETYRFSVPSYVKENRLTLTTRDGQQYLLIVSGDKVVVHCMEDLETTASKQANPDGSYDYTYTLTGDEECLLDVIRNSVSGTYRASKTVRAAYRMTFDTGIRRIETDGVVTYELRLPQTRYAITCNGGVSISGTSRLITDVHIQAIPKDESRYQASAARQEENP